MNKKHTECFFVGVDGGGTKTVAVVSDLHGRVLGIGLGGPVNIGWVGPEVADESTKTAVCQALAAAQISPDEVSQAYLGMAGVNSERADDKERLVFLQTMQALGFVLDRTTVDNDAFVGMASAVGSGPGVVVVGGTGFTAKGISMDGRRITLPWYVAERGAGHIIGRLAAKTALFDLLGVCQSTSITPRVMNILGLTNARQLEQWLAVGRSSWELGQLTPVVSDAAQAGDCAAQELLKTAGMEFGLAAAFIARKAGLTDCKVGIIGGVFKAGDFVTAPMQAVLAASGIEAELVPPIMPPVGGAIILGWNKSGHLIDNDSLEKLANEISRLCPDS